MADIWTDPKPPGREGTHIYTYTRGRGDEGYTYLFFQFGETRAYIYIYVHNIRLYAPCGAAVDPPARVKVLAHVYIYIRTYVQDFYHIRVYILWQACVNARVFFHSLFRPPENICRSFVCDQRAAAAAVETGPHRRAAGSSKTRFGAAHTHAQAQEFRCVCFTYVSARGFVYAYTRRCRVHVHIYSIYIRALHTPSEKRVV